MILAIHSLNRIGAPLAQLVKLKYLFLSAPKFNGIVGWQHLPASLSQLHIMYSGFQGTVDWSKIRELENLEFLFLYQNKFWGTIDLRNMPIGLQFVRLNGNAFEKTIFDENEWRFDGTTYIRN